MTRRILTLSALALLGAAGLVARGEDNAPKAAPNAKPDGAAENAAIDGWVQQLDHAQLTKREEAQRNLLKAGKAAIPALAKAALSDKKEMIEKSIAILKTLAQSDDKPTQEAAKGTLTMLSESDKPSTAQRAKLALNTQDGDGIKPFEGWDKSNALVGAGGGVNRSVSVSNVNGRRSITVKEGDIQTKIDELNGGKIAVRVTGGKEKVDLTVSGVEELKKKAPDAHALYEQYAGGKGGGGAGGAVGGTGGEMMVKQLEQLKEQFKGHPTMQQLLDEQIKIHKKK